MISKSILKYPSIKSKLVETKANSYKFVVEPLLHGYGYTLGNSLRRLLLSSIPGYGVTSVRINDLTHEYQSIDGVVEDAIDVILNIKNLKAKILTDDDSVTIKLNKSNAGEVLAGDFDTQNKLEIVNKDLFVCYLSKDIDLDIEIEVSRGVGYLSSDKIDYVGNIDPHKILVDTLFSPVSDVSLNVEQVRVGDKTDFDKLVLNFATDGTVDGKEVIEFALAFLNDLFLQVGSSLNLSNILSKQEGEEKLAQMRAEQESAKLELAKRKEQEKAEKIDLDKNILAILEKHEITTLSELKDLVENEPKKLEEDFAGLKKKDIKEIKNYVKDLDKQIKS